MQCYCVTKKKETTKKGKCQTVPLALMTRKARGLGILGFPMGLGFGDVLGVRETDLGVLNAIMGFTMKPVLQVGRILLDRRRFAFKRYHLP